MNELFDEPGPVNGLPPIFDVYFPTAATSFQTVWYCFMRNIGLHKLWPNEGDNFRRITVYSFGPMQPFV